MVSKSYYSIFANSYLYSTATRLLGLRDGSKLGFWRNLVGQGEKWVVLKAATVATGGLYYQQAAAATGSNSSSKVSFEEPNSKGSAVRLGDMILLQTFKTDHLLTLQTAAGATFYQFQQFFLVILV